MTPLRTVVIAWLFCSSSLAWSQQAASPEKYQSALAAISRTAQEICSTVPLVNKENKVELNADARATFSDLLKRLAKLGVSGSAKYSSSDSEAGLLRTDIVAALKNQDTCRLEVFRTLEAKLLAPPMAGEVTKPGARSVVTPARASAASSSKPRPSKDSPKDIGARQLQPVIDAVDFLRDKPELTVRSLAYLATLAKEFARAADPRITLIPIYQTEVAYHQDQLAEGDSSIRVRRQIAVRNALVASGFPSDNIFMDQGQANVSNHGIRMDDMGRRIEQGIMVQAWP